MHESSVSRTNRERIFIAGCALTVAGAVLHWPDFIAAGSMHYRLAGMAMSPAMLVGMGLIGVGLVLAAHGLIQPVAPALAGRALHVQTLDGRKLTAADVRLLVILTVALVIDVMKPATLSFVLPGARSEYGLTTFQIALLPLSGLTGTALGSILWGLMADRAGRRGTLLLAAMLFIATSICGAMPAYGFNLAMCFVMGLSAGGMLPLVFALLAEIAPSGSRGLMMVLIGGLGSAGGYLAASGAAALLEPTYTWRILWLIGMPTGLLLVLFSRFIPESPRFLIMTGRREEAQRLMQRYGATLELVEAQPAAAPSGDAGAGVAALLRPPFAVQTAGLLVFGFAWGVANFGFLTWLPTLLRKGSASAAQWNGVLAKSALIAVPGALLATWLYGRWRARGSIVGFGVITSVCLVALGTVIAGSGGGLLIGVLTVVMLVGINGSSAMLSVYTAEVFPTIARGSGTGLVAAATKFGGLVGPQVVALVLIAGGGARALAWIVAVPLALAGVVLWARGIETRGRSLEEIELALTN